MPIVYIAGPYRAPTEIAVERNIRAAEEAAAVVWQAGGAALCPHKNTAHMGGVVPDAAFLAGDIEMLRLCHAVFMVGPWLRSEGATGERAAAKRAGIPIFDDEVELRRWVGALAATGGPKP